MAKPRVRRWYVVFRIGCEEPRFLISAFSEYSVRLYLKHVPYKFKVIQARAWHLAKAMSAKPFGCPAPSEPAQNDWWMDTGYIVMKIAILN